ncbi:MAG: ROK family protein, partial [Ruminococcus flavefaciens]|nr:ROK family protein [Ruminococcus flavefaciens]
RERIAMLTLGSGVGGGYFAHGKLVSDERNDFARFGHIILHENGNACTCGKRGCVETYLSGRAIHKKAQELGVDGGDIFIKYAAGEEPYVKLINNFKNDLKDALNLVCKISPFDLMIIGGGVADWMGGVFENIALSTGYPVVKAKLGNDAGVYGACAHALMKQGKL